VELVQWDEKTTKIHEVFEAAKELVRKLEELELYAYNLPVGVIVTPSSTAFNLLEGIAFYVAKANDLLVNTAELLDARIEWPVLSMRRLPPRVAKVVKEYHEHYEEMRTP